MGDDAFVMPFGKYKGQTLDHIARTNEGLLYLDWAIGEFGEGYVKEAIEDYLDDPVISLELGDLLNNGE